MISAIILAAGLSSRMKFGNKLLLEKNGVSIIKLTLNRLKFSQVNEIIVVVGNDSELVINNIKDEKVKISINNNFKKGISSSIKKGIETVDICSDGVLVCLGDMPLIKTSTYDQIINAFYKNGQKNIVPNFYNKKGNPVLFNKSYFKDIMKINGDEGAKTVIKKNKKDFIYITVDDPGILEDIDNENHFLKFKKNEI